jgi:Uma2 family endonuclease
MLQSHQAMSAPLDIPVALSDQRRITVADFHRMVDAGIIDPDERVELLEGVLIAMPPVGEPHSWSIQELNRIITRALPDLYRTRPQLPVTLGIYSEPQPDLAIVTIEQGGRRTEHPESALLVIEVSVSSLRYDRNAKAAVYARAGIPEYWIVDVEGRAVEVRVDPDPVAAKWRSMTRLGPSDVLQARAVPLPPIPIADILP